MAPELEIQKALELLRAGKSNEARPLLARFLKVNPAHARAWHLLAYTLEDRDQKIEALQRAVALDPANAKAKTQLQKLTPKAIAISLPRTTVQQQSESLPKKAFSKTWLYLGIGAGGLGGALVLLLIFLFLQNTFRPNPNAPPTTSLPGLASPTAVPAQEPTATLPPSPTPLPTEIPAYIPQFTPGNCPYAIPIGALVECGFLEVPEDRENLAGRTIQIAVTRYRSTASQPLPDPLVFLPGGPGAGALQQLATVYPRFMAPFLAERDFIVFDPRGTGYSQPSLACPEIATVYLDDLAGLLADNDRSMRYTAAFQTCRDRLQGNGINLARYTSTENAADVHDLATALGYEQINLFGVSYGTRLAQIIMRDDPTWVRSAILDSVLPLEVKNYNESAARAKLALQTLFEACASDPACQAAYPDLEPTFYRLVAQLDTDPLKLEIPHPLTGQLVEVEVRGSGLISSLMWEMHTTTFISALPLALSNLQAGDPAPLSYYLSLPVSTYQNISLGVLASTNCQEQVFATTLSEMEAALTNAPDMAAYGRAATYGGAASLFAICELWLGASVGQADISPLQSDLSTLILAGQFDPTTPPSYGQQLAGNLPHSYFFTFPGQGHTPSIISDDPCPLQIVATFLHDPDAAPEGTCLDEMARVSFILPASPGNSVTFSDFLDAEGDFTGQRPQGWREAGFGFFNRTATFFDVTQLGMQNAIISIPEWLDYLNTHFQNTGFDQFPEAAGEFRTLALTWQLYRTQFHGNPVDLALAEINGVTYMAVLLSHHMEHEALYEVVFLPMLQAITPAR